MFSGASFAVESFASQSFGLEDTDPNAFSFAPQIGVARSTLVTSESITITGIDAPAPSVVLNGEYSVNDAPFTTVPGIVNAGDTIRLQHPSSAEFYTTVTTTFTVGSISGAFTSTTLVDGTILPPQSRTVRAGGLSVESAWPQKHPAETLDYAVDFELLCARQWNRWTDFSAGQRIRVYRPGHGSGYEFEVTTPGRTGGRPPAFLTGQPVVDGSVIWTPRAISAGSLLRTIIGTPTWSADGVDFSGESLVGMKGIAKIGGGTDAHHYSVTVTARTSDDLDLVKVVTLPVRET